jgi:predicted transcriptional regulator
MGAILQAAVKGATKSRLSYGAYLSNSKVQEYLAALQEMGLLFYDEESQLYVLKERGLKFLHAYEEIETLIRVQPSGRESRTEMPIEIGA